MLTKKVVEEAERWERNFANGEELRQTTLFWALEPFYKFVLRLTQERFPMRDRLYILLHGKLPIKRDGGEQRGS